MRISFAVSALLCFSIAASAQDFPKLVPDIVSLSAQKAPGKCTQRFTILLPPTLKASKVTWAIEPSGATNGAIDKNGCYTVPKIEDNKPIPVNRVTVTATINENLSAKATIVLKEPNGPRAINIVGEVYGTEEKQKTEPHDALIRVTDLDDKVIGYGVTKNDGKFNLCTAVPASSQIYQLVVGKEGHRQVTRELNFTGIPGVPGIRGLRMS